MISHGIDIIDIKRVENIYKKYSLKFLKKVFTEQEIEKNTFQKISSSRALEKIAGRFATKEAAYKALELNSKIGIGFHDFIITENRFGNPSLILSEKVKKLIKTEFKISVSISHEKDFAIASVIIFYY